MKADIQIAIDVLKQGGIVIYPTDTAFGIGCRIDDEVAVKRLFKIRNRPPNQPTPVIVDTVKMAREYVEEIPDDVIEKLIEPYWPGALTIILRSIIVKVPQLVRGGGDTIGVRIPNHEITRTLIREVGVPILGPSANFHGEKTPFLFEEINPELIKLVDYVIPKEIASPAELVRNDKRLASTVIDCSQKPWRIIRQGAVKVQNTKIKTNKILLIDTTNNQKIIVGLKIHDKKFKKERKVDKNRDQAVLPLINEILNEHQCKPSDINSIEVNTGPGSFTGIRVGISIANALSFALKIPVNNKPLGKFVEGVYE